MNTTVPDVLHCCEVCSEPASGPCENCARLEAISRMRAAELYGSMQRIDGRPVRVPIGDQFGIALVGAAIVALGVVFLTGVWTIGSWLYGVLAQ